MDDELSSRSCLCSSMGSQVVILDVLLRSDHDFLEGFDEGFEGIDEVEEEWENSWRMKFFELEALLSRAVWESFELSRESRVVFEESTRGSVPMTDHRRRRRSLRDSFAGCFGWSSWT